MKIRKLLLVAFLASMAGTAWAQNVNISGRVVDSAGMPLPGVNIVVEGTATGTISDADGNYTLAAPQGANLVYSFIGFDVSKVQVVGGQTNYDVTLNEEVSDLAEVVVVGYGVQKKSVVTASIAKVGADDLNGTTPLRVDNAL